MTIILNEFPTFGRVATWEEWKTTTIDTLPEYLFPAWFISNMVGFLLLWIAFKCPRISRKVWGFFMILASFANAFVVLQDQKGLIEYGVLAIPPMQHFIYSILFANPILLLTPIVLCQLWVGFILLFSETPSLIKAAMAGAIIFFLSIATLGIGSGFPASLIYASTMVLCWPPPSATNRKRKIL